MVILLRIKAYLPIHRTIPKVLVPVMGMRGRYRA